MRDYSNYHKVDFTDKLVRDGVYLFEKSLESSPESYSILVKDVEKRVMIQATANYNERRILFTSNTLRWGDILIHEGEEWLVTERPYFNKIYEKSKIELCTADMIFATLSDGYYEETDRHGRPIWINPPQEVLVSFPCVISTISDLNTKTSLGHRINVPEGDVVLSIPYTSNDLIKVSNKFQLHDEEYVISGIDRSKLHKDHGVLIVVASRIAKNT